MGYFVPSIPLHLNEFKDRGIWLEQDRYTKPYITDTVLQDIFRESAEQIMELYLDEKGDGFYALKPDFDTQKGGSAFCRSWLRWAGSQNKDRVV